MDELAPIKEVRLKQRTEPWLEADILDLIRSRDQLLFEFRKGGQTEKFDQYKKVRNTVQYKIHKAKSNYYYSKTQEYKHAPKKLWQTLKDIGTSKTTRTKETNLGLNIEGEVTFDKERVGQAFNTYFTSIASSLVSKLPSCTGIFGKEFVTDYYQSKGVVQNTFRLSPVGEESVLKLLQKLSPSKATGLDNIPAKFVREGASQLTTPITHIVNLSMHTNKIPVDLKNARVVPLHKKNSKTDPGNYRPVSILTITSKILERVVFDQVEGYLKHNKILYDLQSGFRPSYSTDSTLIHLTDHIKFQSDLGNYTGMVVLDLQKAFDTVAHDILLHKLEAIGMNDGSVDWFRSYLTGREQVVDINKTISPPCSIICGVPQGSILGPLLFLIYVNDMAGAVKCKLLLYADDSALMVSHKDPSIIEKTLSSEMDLISK